MIHRLLYLLLLTACSPAEVRTDVAEDGANLAQEAPAPAPAVLAKKEQSDHAKRENKRSLDSILNLTYVTGKFEPAGHPAFVRVAKEFTDGDPYLLHRETYAAFREMHAAAKADGVALTIISATRNFARQQSIWEAKWNGHRLLEGKEKANEVYPDAADRALAILRYSSMPGTSRHHWGTDVDLNALTNGYFDTGIGKEVYAWLTANAARFGFCQPYTEKGPLRPNGYEEERWHWSYLPLARPLTSFAATALRDTDINGFDGAAAAPRIEVVHNYVLGVNPTCREK